MTATPCQKQPRWGVACLGDYAECERIPTTLSGSSAARCEGHAKGREKRRKVMGVRVLLPGAKGAGSKRNGGDLGAGPSVQFGKKRRVRPRSPERKRLRAPPNTQPTPPNHPTKTTNPTHPPNQRPHQPNKKKTLQQRHPRHPPQHPTPTTPPPHNQSPPPQPDNPPPQPPPTNPQPPTSPPPPPQHKTKKPPQEKSQTFLL